MPDFKTMTCRRCGETFPIGQAHNEVHCNQHLTETALRVEREERRRVEETRPEPPYPPLETI